MTIFAWLCPFIYVEITLSGIINGFGLTKNTCIYNIISAIILVRHAEDNKVYLYDVMNIKKEKLIC